MRRKTWIIMMALLAAAAITCSFLQIQNNKCVDLYVDSYVKYVKASCALSKIFETEKIYFHEVFDSFDENKMEAIQTVQKFISSQAAADCIQQMNQAVMDMEKACNINWNTKTTSEQYELLHYGAPIYLSGEIHIMDNPFRQAYLSQFNFAKGKFETNKICQYLLNVKMDKLQDVTELERVYIVTKEFARLFAVYYNKEGERNSFNQHPPDIHPIAYYTWFEEPYKSRWKQFFLLQWMNQSEWLELETGKAWRENYSNGY